MAQITEDFVKETSTVTGTGDILLAGVRGPAARAFGSVCANGDTLEYAISHDTLNQWEVGLGTYNAGANSITRTTVQRSSNSNLAVNFSAGTKKVDLVLSGTRIRRMVGPVIAGAATLGSGSLSFDNGGGVSFGLSTNSNGGTITASAPAGGGGASEIGLVSHVGGNSQSGVTRLAFSNASNVTWALSTAGSAVTVRASVDPTGRVALDSPVLRTLTDMTDTASLPIGSIAFESSLNQSIVSVPNLFFRISGSTLHGAAAMFWGATNGLSQGHILSFSDSNGVTFGGATTSLANRGRAMVVTASYARELGLVSLVGGSTVSSATRLAFSAAGSGVALALSTAAGAATLTVSGIPMIGMVSHVGGNSVAGATQLAFSNASNVTWSLSTAAGAATVLASVGAGGGGIASFSLSNLGVSASAYGDATISGTNVALQALSNIGGTAVYSSINVGWVMSDGSNLAAVARLNFLGFNSTGGATNLQVQHLSFVSNSAFGVTMTHSTFANFGSVGQVQFSAMPRVGLVSHVGGNSAADVTQIAFSNASNVTWSLSTAASAVTVLASVAAGGGGGGAGTISLASNATFSGISSATDSSVSVGLVHYPLADSGDATNLGRANVLHRISSDTIYPMAFMYALRDANNLSVQAMGVRNSNGNQWTLVSTTIASLGRVAYWDLRAAIAISAGTAFAFAQNIGFVDTNGASWNYSGSQLSIDYAAPRAVVAGTETVTNGTLSFSDANGVSFGLDAGTLTASVAGGGGIAASAAGSSQSAGTVVWSNSNNVSFGMNGSTVTASASFADPERLGVVSHVGGNVVSDVTLLAFSDGSNVTWSASTAAGAVTMRASVAGGGGGGVTYQGFYPWLGGIFVTNQGIANNQVWVNPMTAPNFSFNRVALMMSISNSSNSSGSHTMRMALGIYTRNANTLSLLVSTSGSTAITFSGTAGAYSQLSGARLWSMSWGSSFSAGDYWLALITSLSTGGANVGSFSLGMYSQNLGAASLGFIGAGTATSNQPYLGKGIFNTTTTAPPNSMAFSQLNFAGSSVAWRFPYLNFASGTA